MDDNILYFPTINCWHKTIQQPFNHKTAHWLKITNWFDCILAATCCNRRVSRHKPLRSSTYWEPLGVWWGRWLTVSIVSRTTVEPICSPVFPDRNSTCVCTGHSFTDNFHFILLLYSCCINLFVVDTCLFHSRMWLKQEKKTEKCLPVCCLRQPVQHHPLSPHLDLGCWEQAVCFADPTAEAAATWLHLCHNFAQKQV